MNDYELSFPSKGEEPFPLLLILPVLGQLLFFSDLWIERIIARFFTRRGFAVAIVHRDFFSYDSSQSVEQVDRYLSKTVQRAKETLDELTQNPRIDSARVASLGISFGGVLNVLLLAEDSRIKASVIALAGGNLPEIIATSRDPLLKSYCNDLVKGMGKSRQELVALLKKQLKEEPLQAAGKLDPAKILMVIARLDRVVFPRYAMSLWNALGRPKTIFLPLGHYFSLLAVPYLNRQAFAFFKQKLFAVSDTGV